jgi:hypothetical protein
VEIEIITPGPINKDVSPREVDKQGNRIVVNPYLDRINSRYRSTENGSVEGEQNIPGTVSHSNTLPSGTNKTIATFTDRESGNFIYWNWNSNSNHGIYTWNPITNAFQTLI